MLNTVRKTKNALKHVLISQIKNVGDVVLALPIVGLIRAHSPTTTISFLARHYTQPIISGCPDIDHMFDWDALKILPDAHIIQQWQAAQITAIIHLCPDNRIARLAKEAGILCRIGTFQRLPHWIYCNRWINQARRHSHLHEVMLNVHMLKPLHLGLSSTLHSDITTLIPYLHLVPRVPLPTSIASLLLPDRFNLILHPGSNGHGREWPSDSFRQLIEQLPATHYRIFLTGSLQEKERFKTLIAQSPQAIDIMGTLQLSELMTFISHADGLVASGTGPLHLAAALGIKTLGLFPPRQGISPRRWAPIGKQATSLVYERPFFKACFSCQTSIGCACMTQITVAQVLKVIQSWLQ